MTIGAELDSMFCKHTIQKNLKIQWGVEHPDPSLGTPVYLR